MPVEIDNQVHNVYVLKRPGVDTFLEKMGELFEVVIFTASVSKVTNDFLNFVRMPIQKGKNDNHER